MEFLDWQQSIINQYTYYDTLVNLRNTIKAKRHGLLTQQQVCLLHDNAKPRTVNFNVGPLADFWWDVLPHSPYSPNDAPSDYHLFLRLKKELEGRRFENNEELIVPVWEILSNLGRDFYRNGIEKLVQHLNKSLDPNGVFRSKNSVVPPLFNKLCF